MPRFAVHTSTTPVKAQLCNPIFSRTKTYNPMLILSVLLLIAFIFGQQMLKEA